MLSVNSELANFKRNVTSTKKCIMTNKICTIIFSILFTGSCNVCYACTMENISNWLLPVTQSIYDTDRGIFFQRKTSSISAINSVSFSEGLNSGPYLSVLYNEDEFTISTNEQFQHYENYETTDSMGVTVVFRCTDSSLSTLVFSINVIDTNNNAPQFKPNDTYNFKIAPPVPPGFLITDCVNDIIVRDIDLTTYGIIFEMEENSYFEIEYDTSTIPKEFKATVKTTTFIRRISEPIKLWISATDVDSTGDPPLTTNATILIEADNEFEFPDDLIFSETFYVAEYTEKHEIILENTIYLSQGYDEKVTFSLEGGYEEYFELIINGNEIDLQVKTQLAPEISQQMQIYLVIKASREYTSGATATIILKLDEEIDVNFEEAFYRGYIEDNNLFISNLVLQENNENANISVFIYSEYSNYFNANIQNNTITLQMNPLDDNILLENNILTLKVAASTQRNMAITIVILEIIKDDKVTPIFEKKIYNATYDPEVGVAVENIVLIQGYDNTVSFSLEGEYENYFQIKQEGPLLNIITSSLPSQVLNEQQLLLIVQATKPRTVGAHALVYIAIPEDSKENNVFFDKLLYKGVLRDDDVSHEYIFVSGYDGTNINILGEYGDFFVAEINAGEVKVKLSDSTTAWINSSHIVLELHVPDAGAVLILDVADLENPILPTVKFASDSYVIQVEKTQTGFIGQVTATADNGEAVSYSLEIDNDHLQDRLSINNNGELHLSAPANSGVYSFQVVATSIYTRVNGTAKVQLTVEAVTTCSTEIVVPPLIVMDRDEEEAYENLVVLNSTTLQDCRYEITNLWPVEQNWLYVDEYGLHTRSIDREDPSIAFMALSQIHVELILHCKSDEPARTKRSINADAKPNPLGPYDYGTHKWVLTDTILYNARRSVVNLIVNDINDNDPIFIGKENEPIAVGYPLPELEEIVSPRALVKLKATDADIGENAALVYWSPEPILAVSPASGFVHVSNNANLEDGARLTVYATDRNGLGRTGHIDLVMRLLDINHIAVMTIRNSFLEDEETILSDLDKLLGYEVKALRAIVIPMSSETEEHSDVFKNNRENSTSTGAVLQLFVYGLIDREPIEVNQLTSDINSNVLANVASTLSLEDHLESREICSIPERDTGLLVATIILSILFCILIMVLALWLFLKWRKKENFSEENSLVSRDQYFQESPKNNEAVNSRPDLDELKRSENRLQEVLDVPVEQPNYEPTLQKEVPLEAIINQSLSEPRMPIIIQSIDKLKDAEVSDDEDEFGESKKRRRKSVVTFNENVEKIIHFEDSPNDTDYEVHRF
ncbi:unnamed protein product [Parnassius apollo]|uniref:(apollo) hypothetical protein n=1 Tax=Parnassius apollo TaxID=110799 RepID=A0A8S3XTP3_PARAO|nr:unnamed protein product [Parnassius apollo]